MKSGDERNAFAEFVGGNTRNEFLRTERVVVAEVAEEKSKVLEKSVDYRGAGNVLLEVGGEGGGGGVVGEDGAEKVLGEGEDLGGLVGDLVEDDGTPGPGGECHVVGVFLLFFGKGFELLGTVEIEVGGVLVNVEFHL